MVFSHVDSISAGALAHHILVVDDDSAAAESLKVCLEQHGFHVQIAKDGGQAHAASRMRRPDFVLLDLILSGENGFEVLDRLKREDDTIPVLILSATQLPESKSFAERLGADGYLLKPVDLNDLISTIKEIAQRVWERVHGGEREEKRIRFNCRCGKKFKVSPVHRGRTLTCPDCGEPLVVPRHD